MSYGFGVSFEKLIELFYDWARDRPDIRALAIIGSRAQADHPADEWADLDVVVVTTDPKRYGSQTSWLGNIWKPWLTYSAEMGEGAMILHVVFEGGLDADIDIFPEGVKHEALGFYLQRGFRVLLDKDGIFAKPPFVSPAEASRPQSPPTEREFLEIINSFWFNVLWTAKHIMRGELWWSKQCADVQLLQWNTLRMVEWHTRTTRGWDFDTWYNGRFLEEWADPRVLEGLHYAFAHYDKEDIIRALITSMKLFRWIAMETADRLSYAYPIEVDKHITELVDDRLSPSPSRKER